jgi:hypothetical protein
VQFSRRCGPIGRRGFKLKRENLENMWTNGKERIKIKKRIGQTLPIFKS